MLGYDSVWAADRIVIPWKIATPYPYSEEQRFIVPPDRPFLEPLTCLAFLAGCTEKVKLGMSILVLPYRHPLYWAKIERFAREVMPPALARVLTDSAESEGRWTFLLP